MLKYQNIAVVGDRIRAYDFAGRTDCYVEGIVCEIDTEGTKQGFAAFIISVDVDGWPTGRSFHTEELHKIQGRVGCITYVPM